MPHPAKGCGVFLLRGCPVSGSCSIFWKILNRLLGDKEKMFLVGTVTKPQNPTAQVAILAIASPHSVL
jgi:hypothetical protein